MIGVSLDQLDERDSMLMIGVDDGETVGTMVVVVILPVIK